MASSRADWRSAKFKQLSTDMAAAAAAMAALRAENARLKDDSASLIALNRIAAYLGSLLATAEVHTVALPSARVGPCPVEEAVALAYATAASGRPVAPELVLATLDCPPDVFYRKSMVWLGDLAGWLDAWAASRDPLDRAMLEFRVSGVMRWGLEWRRGIAQMRPGTLVQYFQSVFRTDRGATAARQSRQREIVSKMSLGPEGVEQLKTALAQWSSHIRRVEVQALSSLSAAAPEMAQIVDNSTNMRNAAATVLAINEGMERRAQGVMLAYTDFDFALRQALSWLEWAVMVIGMVPYTPDLTEVCQEILVRVGAARHE